MLLPILSKLLIVGLLILASPAAMAADSVIGAWGDTLKDPSGKQIEMVVLLSERHQVAAWFDAETGALVSTNGGTWTLEGDILGEVVEFDSQRPERVGSSVSFKIEVTPTTLSMVDFDSTIKRIGDDGQRALDGAWERVEIRKGGKGAAAGSDNEKTIRLMLGGRFQEITFHPSSGKVLTTRGGEYRLDENAYTERVLFQSADPANAESSSWHLEMSDEGTWYLHRSEATREAWRRR